MPLPFTRAWNLARLGHSSPRVRRRAVRALAASQDSGVVFSLLSRLDDPNPEVREAAESVLRKFHPELLIEPLPLFLRVYDSWSLRRKAADFLLGEEHPANEPLSNAVGGLKKFVEEIPELSSRVDQYIYANLHAALAITSTGGTFLVNYAPAKTVIGPVEMKYEVIDSWHHQSNYGSGNPNWDSVGMTCRYEDGYEKTFTYEGMGVPRVCPTARYTQGLIEVPEQFEVVRVDA